MIRVFRRQETNWVAVHVAVALFMYIRRNFPLEKLIGRPGASRHVLASNLRLLVIEVNLLRPCKHAMFVPVQDIKLTRAFSKISLIALL